MSIARYYDESKNESGAALPGVPLRDLEQDEFDALPDWLQASVDAWDAYRKSKPRSDAKPAHGKLPPVSSKERTAPGTGQKMTAIEHPADGSLSDELTGDDESTKPTAKAEKEER